ncbi:hypothetical protein G5V57_23415 [Nordella sp. HKS 07]|uniref:hypothetical protein n=1 Tax=Nordella sp. HKS 07 TaxID=2712222 RepID=UPI0013E0F0EF|nr:hypothetical protein [Nordella sp. HKS 07]QIG50419.1 hypothetical protein G5V57_23415 [Nordella sp. HKS 07]
MKNDPSWIDHLNHTQGFANLLPVAAVKVADPELRDSLLSVAKVIDEHIQKGIDNAEAELIELSSFSDFGV